MLQPLGCTAEAARWGAFRGARKPLPTPESLFRAFECGFPRIRTCSDPRHTHSIESKHIYAKSEQRQDEYLPP